MIHYTLLPEKEMIALRREYRIRIFIILTFFISLGIIVGIGFLIPSYILTYSQEKASIKKIENIQKDREVRGIDTILAELSVSTDLLKKLKTDEDQVVFFDKLKNILSYKTPTVSISAISISKNNDASMTVSMIVQGKAVNRDALLQFKSKLEQNNSVVKVELPVSDLAKSKDVSFSIRITLQ